jgi:hypothetical protein
LVEGRNGDRDSQLIDFASLIKNRFRLPGMSRALDD